MVICITPGKICLMKLGQERINSGSYKCQCACLFSVAGIGFWDCLQQGCPQLSMPNIPPQIPHMPLNMSEREVAEGRRMLIPPGSIPSPYSISMPSGTVQIDEHQSVHDDAGA